MKNLIAGQKLKLSDLTPSIDLLTLGLAADFGSNVSVDFSCFGVDHEGQLSDDRYMVFFNQKASPCGSIVMQEPQGRDAETFALKLMALPATIKKLVFTVTIDGEQTMAQMQSGYLRLAAAGSEVARFEFDGQQFQQEKAIIVGEIYLKEVWRLGAVGQGFNGGLSALLAYFGGEEESEVAAPPTPVVKPTPVAAKPRVSLSKITLDKKGDKRLISLKKTTDVQPIKVNLNWNHTPTQKKGLFGFGNKSSAPDLDLGCFVRMNNGEQGVIQPLGGNLGSRSEEPYILLDKDDRTGQASDGENLTVYRPDLVDFMVVFAMIYEGADDFSSVDARLTVKDPQGNEILIKLNAPDPRARFCVAAAFKRTASGFEIGKEERYFNAGHKEADEHYGFGFKWTAGSK